MTRRLALFICIVFAFFTPTFEAIGKTKLLIGHSSHPLVNEYKSFYSQVYMELGIKLRFVQLPAERRLLSLEQGVVDGLMAVASFRSEQDNLTIIETPIAKIRVSLFCGVDVECTVEALYNPLNEIYTNRGHLYALEREIGIKLKANVNFIENQSSLAELLLKGRIDYLIISDSIALSRKKLHEHFNEIVLGHYPVFHVVSKEHYELAPEINNAIKMKIHLIEKYL